MDLSRLALVRSPTYEREITSEAVSGGAVRLTVLHDAYLANR